MGSADHVDIGLFHEPQVGFERRAVDRSAGTRVVFVAVDAFQFHGLSVDVKHLATHLGTAHTCVKTKTLDHLASLPQRDVDLIEMWFLCRPQARVLQSGTDRQFGGVARTHPAQRSAHEFVHLSAVAVFAPEHHLHRDVTGLPERGVANAENCPEFGRREILRRLGHQRVVGDVHCWAHPQFHGPEDAAQSPHVLILEVAAVGPAVDLHGEAVGAGAHMIRDVEPGRGVGVLAVPHPLAVDPHVHGRLYPLEKKMEPVVAHRRSDLERREVRSHGIAVFVAREVLGRCARHTRLISEEGIRDVGVDRHSVPLGLPVAGHSDRTPPRRVEIVPVKVGGAALRVFRPVESPLPVERHDLAALLLQ